MKRGGGKGERESSRREGTKVDGRRDKVGQRLSNGSEQVPGPLLTSPRPPVGGERVTVRASATEDTWFSVKRDSERGNVGAERREKRSTYTVGTEIFEYGPWLDPDAFVSKPLALFLSVALASHWSVRFIFPGISNDVDGVFLRRYFFSFSILQMKRFLVFEDNSVNYA